MSKIPLKEEAHDFLAKPPTLAQNLPPQARDDISDANGLDTGTETTTRQEFAQEADINYILDRFGVNQQQRPVTYGEVDYTVDLQQTLHAAEQLKRAHLNVPDELRDKYPTWESVLAAAETGEYQNDLDTVKLAREQAAIRQKQAEAMEETTRQIELREAAERQIRRRKEDAGIPEPEGSPK